MQHLVKLTSRDTNTVKTYSKYHHLCNYHSLINLISFFIKRLIFIITLFLLIFSRISKNVFAATWLSGYNYQKVFYINGSTAGAVANYPIKISLNSGTGQDIGSTFYLDNHSLNNFNDIRFTSSDGVTLLNYWVESSNPTNSTVWVNLDSVPASPGQKTFYLYYGNDTAVSLSSGSNTFSFYDGFDTDGISLWTGSDQNKHIGESATQSISSNVKQSSPNSAILYTYANCSASPFDGVGSILTRSPNLVSGNYKVEFEVIREITGFIFNTIAYERSIVTINGAVGFTDSSSCSGVNCTVPPSDWSNQSINVVNSPINTIGLEGYSDDCTHGNVWFDNVRIRNYISPEPSMVPTVSQETTSENNNSSSSLSVSSTDAPSCPQVKPATTPDLFQIDATSTTVKLFFTPISNTSDFYISFSENPNAERHGAVVSLANSGVQNFTVNFLKPNTIYYFKVRGQNGCMPGDWSNVMKIKTIKKVFYKSNK